MSWAALIEGRRPRVQASLKRAYVNSSELSVGSIGALLLADLLADLFHFKPYRRNGIAPSPEMLA
jgi:hypothetical protein